MNNLDVRPRRLRVNHNMREMVRETRLSPKSLILPIFLKDGKNIKTPIASLDGHFHYSVDRVFEEIERCQKAGVKSVILFGLPQKKDECGSAAYSDEGVIQQGIREIRAQFKSEITIVTDVCMCEYTSHGHCGLLKGDVVDNDSTLDSLAKIAVSHAAAGADIIAPSDMMDGRVRALRNALDKSGFEDRAILSYAVKYASAFYGPFRDAAGSAPTFGDRKSYQMDYHNAKEALKEAQLDTNEGADMLMVKPALSYLDIVAKVAAASSLPTAAYSVSGEYMVIKAAAAQGLVDEYALMCESAVSIYRAGADILVSYYAKEIAEAMRKGDIG